jgi:hypothetical protein
VASNPICFVRALTFPVALPTVCCYMREKKALQLVHGVEIGVACVEVTRWPCYVGGSGVSQGLCPDFSTKDK